MPDERPKNPPTGPYLVGIDLGTTNSALAYVDSRQRPQDGRPQVRHFPVPQLVAAGEVAERSLLPSYLYLPGEHDLPPGATVLPWDSSGKPPVGEFARIQGSRVPGRLVTSAKSWLCHAGVDRSAPLLPFGAAPDVPRISPVEASARYLRHMVEAWNHVLAHGRSQDRLENQTVVLTVPASFDDVARTLTVEAARKAGLEHLILLEEPQAAFYCWLMSRPQAEASALRPGMRCLVVDVGGGTSDFSLIEVTEQQGELGFIRQAVGNHLLLGGDNMDLALAKFVESRLFKGAGGKLDAAQYGLLTQACRQAKESLLGENPPGSHSVTVMGRGRSVIASSLHTEVTPEDVRHIIFDGFFPPVPRDATAARGARTGLHEMGLPYVNDPAVTRHLAEFLNRHLPDHGTRPVDAILFNGGVFQPRSLRDHLLRVMHSWYDLPQRPWQPLVLTTPSLDLAVALGAACYGWIRHVGGKRIGGGIARSYYLGVQGASEPAGGERPLLCVVPQHLEEGHEIALEKPVLELSLGRPVTFPLYTSTVRGEDHAGEVIRVKPEQMLRLPPLHTVLRGGKRAGVKDVPVTIAARVTEIGTLELFCVAREGSNRWRLEFNVRELVEPTPEEEEAGAPAAGLGDVWPEEQVQSAAALIRSVFSETGSGELKPQELTGALERALDTPRDQWPTGLCRRLWDFLLEVAEWRRLSAAHLNRWYNLAGFVLRPGFGDPADRYRIEQLWKIILAPPRQAATPTTKTLLRVPEGGAQQWILWRRVAGGLHAAYQNALWDRLRTTLLPAKGTPKPDPNELAEMWRAAASLERLDARIKEALGQQLLKVLRRSPVPPYAFWSLTRLGARVLLYGPLNTVVHKQVVESWLDAILPFEPGNQSETLAWGLCLSQLARKTGQRALDVDESRQRSVLTVLRRLSVPQDWVLGVEQVIERRGEEQTQLFGDSLPIGLRLVASEDNA